MKLKVLEQKSQESPTLTLRVRKEERLRNWRLHSLPGDQSAEAYRKVRRYAKQAYLDPLQPTVCAHQFSCGRGKEEGKQELRSCSGAGHHHPLYPSVSYWQREGLKSIRNSNILDRRSTPRNRDVGTQSRVSELIPILARRVES